jgi:hypothetical protein
MNRQIAFLLVDGQRAPSYLLLNNENKFLWLELVEAAFFFSRG